MAQSVHQFHDFDPFSEHSLSAVEQVEALPHSIAFEHAMYDHRLDRTASYHYVHPRDTERDGWEDLDPLTVDANLMVSQFPEELRPLFPDVSYVISRLQVQQVDTPDSRSLELAFRANDTPHHIVLNASDTTATARYETVNESLDDVSYSVSPEAITGLIATFVYARQYDPAQPGTPIELTEGTLTAQRDPLTSFTEQLVMTLGDHSGHSTLETRAIFDNPYGSPVVATLREQEFPDKSGVGNTLLLAEVTDLNDVPTATETSLYQKVVNVEQGSWILPAGQMAVQYAEQKSSVLRSPSVVSSELIDPAVHYARWARMCVTFLKVIEKPLAPYGHLDDTVLD